MYKLLSAIHFVPDVMQIMDIFSNDPKILPTGTHVRSPYLKRG